MIFEWESDEARLLRHMKIPAQKKLEWLYQMNEFINKFSFKKQQKIRRRIRRNR